MLFTVKIIIISITQLKLWIIWDYLCVIGISHLHVNIPYASMTSFTRGNEVNQHSSIGRFFRSLLWRWRKMAALPLPVAILDDLISGSRKWGHPRWRPEAEGPPFCATATIGVEKTAPGPGWRHFRPRHLGSKMATVEMTSRGRRDAREDVLQTSASSMSPEVVWLYWKHLIVSLTQALSKWLSELPACYYAEVISLHMSKVMKNLRLQQAPTLLFFDFIFLFF